MGAFNGIEKIHESAAAPIANCETRNERIQNALIGAGKFYRLVKSHIVPWAFRNCSKIRNSEYK